MASECGLCYDLDPCGRKAASPYGVSTLRPPVKVTGVDCEPERALRDGKKAHVPVQGNHLSSSSFSDFVLTCEMKDDELNLSYKDGSGKRKETTHHRTVVSMFSNLKNQGIL